MVCRTCGRKIEFISVPSEYYATLTRVKAIHRNPRKLSLNENLISDSHKNTLRRELERNCGKK